MMAIQKLLVCLLLIIGQSEAFTVVSSNGLLTNSNAIREKHVVSEAPIIQRSGSSRGSGRLVALTMASSPTSDENDCDDYSFNPANIPFGIVWATLMYFVTFVAPGDFQSDYDTGIIQSIVDNPQNPDLNPLFYMVFNQFVIMSSALACITYPQASRKGPPATPFVLAAVFAGYFVFAPYLVLRGTPKEEVALDELGWVTANVLENKLFNAGTVALSAFFLTQVPWGDLSSLVQGYADMASVSKLVSVSSVDLTLLSLTAAALIPQDYRLRNPHDEGRANLIAASTLLLPVLGSAIYCLLRPSLPESRSEDF